MHYATQNLRILELRSNRKEVPIRATESRVIRFLRHGELKPLIGLWVISKKLVLLGKDIVLAVQEEKWLLSGDGDGGGEGGGGGD